MHCEGHTIKSDRECSDCCSAVAQLNWDWGCDWVFDYRGWGWDCVFDCLTLNVPTLLTLQIPAVFRNLGRHYSFYSCLRLPRRQLENKTYYDIACN